MSSCAPFRRSRSASSDSSIGTLSQCKCPGVVGSDISNNCEVEPPSSFCVSVLREIGKRCGDTSRHSVGVLFREVAVEEFSIFTCHASIPSAPTLMTGCQGCSGALLHSTVVKEFFCATQMYGDGDLSLTSTPLVDERVPSTQAYADDRLLHATAPVPQRMVNWRAAFIGGRWRCRRRKFK